MGIVNLTDDSFSGDGVAQCSKAIAQAKNMLAGGADILDVGAESSRPGAKEVTIEEEWQRLYPVLKELITWDVPISIDTYKVENMQKALAFGVDIINDINGFRSEKSFEALANSKAAGVIMHMQGVPATMQKNPHYDNIYDDVAEFFIKQKKLANSYKISDERLIFDVGFGFGKTFLHNQILFQKITEFSKNFSPLLVGISRKSMLGAITGKEVHDRVLASVVAGMLSVQKGARILRVHDVAQTVEALKVIDSLK